MQIDELQNQVRKWSFKNFGENANSYLALLKVQEELGELAAHYIGRLEHRNGKKESDHNEGVKDSTADILIALCVFCIREGIDLNQEVEKVWGEVSQRTFVLLNQDRK